MLTQMWGYACAYHNGVYLCAIHNNTVVQWISLTMTFKWCNKKKKKTKLWAFQFVPILQYLYIYQLSASPHILKLGCSFERGGESEQKKLKRLPLRQTVKHETRVYEQEHITKLNKEKQHCSVPFVNNILTILLYQEHTQLATVYTISCNNGETGFGNFTQSVYNDTCTRPWLLNV